MIMPPHLETISEKAPFLGLFSFLYFTHNFFFSSLVYNYKIKPIFMRKILITRINETEYIVYLMTEDDVKIEAFIEADLTEAITRADELHRNHYISSTEIKK